MKYFMLVGLATLAMPVSAAKLECRQSTFLEAKVPFLTATIQSNKRLKDLKFLYKKQIDHTGLKDQAEVKGELITNNRSPYKGNNRFVFKGGEFILPPDLSEEALEEALETGVGYGKDENGVVITSFSGGGDGAGSHISYRLNCTSDR